MIRRSIARGVFTNVAIKDVTVSESAAQAPAVKGRGKRYASPLGLLIGLGLIWWLFRGVDVRGVAAALRSSSLIAVLIALAIVYVTLPLRALQWLLLLGQPRDARFGAALKAICLGHLGNLVLPARAGEVVRTYSLSRASKLSFSSVLPSALLARVMDIPAILGLLLAAVYLGLPRTLSYGSGGPEAAAVSVNASSLAARLAELILIMIALLLIAYGLRRKLLAVCRAAGERIPGRVGTILSSGATDAVAALSIVGRPRYLLGAQVVSGVCWLLFVTASVPLLLAFGFTRDQAVLIAIVQTAVTSLTFVLPSTPGSIGTFHALCVAALYACVPTVDRDTALAYAVVAHAVGALGPAVPGLLLAPAFVAEMRVLRKGVPRND